MAAGRRLGELVREARVSRGWTMSAVADAVGKSVMYISDIENGKRIPQKTETLEAIGKVLSIRTVDLRVAAATSKVNGSRRSRKEDERRLALARMILDGTLDEDEIGQILKAIRGGEDDID